MNPTPNCPKCSGAMAEGFVLDNAYGALKQSHWLEGKPERAHRTGIFLKSASIITKDRQLLAVTTYRCERCGFLESYARDEGKDAA